MLAPLAECSTGRKRAYDEAMEEGLAEIDAAIAAMERERLPIVSQLRGASGPAAEVLARGLRELDARIADARARRELAARRIERQRRVAAITGELRAIRAEIESGDASAERRATLKARFEALTAEAAPLLAAIRAGTAPPRST